MRTRGAKMAKREAISFSEGVVELADKVFSGDPMLPHRVTVELGGEAVSSSQGFYYISDPRIPITGLFPTLGALKKHLKGHLEQLVKRFIVDLGNRMAEERTEKLLRDRNRKIILL